MVGYLEDMGMIRSRLTAHPSVLPLKLNRPNFSIQDVLFQNPFSTFPLHPAERHSGERASRGILGHPFRSVLSSFPTSSAHHEDFSALVERSSNTKSETESAFHFIIWCRFYILALHKTF